MNKLACGRAKEQEQIPLRFDLQEGQRRKRAGQSRAARSPWIEEAVRVIERVARNYPELTSDEVRAEAERSMLPDPPSKRASWGAAWSIAARKEFVELTDRTRASARIAAHSHRNSVWRSLVYGEGAA